jgi:hypothetical protein
MAGFDLSKHVQSLDWDFGGGVKGTTPEPSTKAVNRFNQRLRDNLAHIGKPVEDRSDTDELMRVMGSLTEDEHNAIHEEAFDAVLELCDGSPSREQLAGLGHRGFQAFLGWISSEVNNPEGLRPATSS